MSQKQVDVEKLLDDKRVLAEINRHLWIESEKVGRDIGFEQAKEDWLKKFSKAWLEYHMPEALTKRYNANCSASRPKAKSRKKTTAKKRRAKSYFR